MIDIVKDLRALLTYFYSQKPSDWIKFWLSSDFIIRLYCWSCCSVSELGKNLLVSDGLWPAYLTGARLPSSSLNCGESSSWSFLGMLSIISLGVFWTFSSTSTVFLELFSDSLPLFVGIAGVEQLKEPLRRFKLEGVFRSSTQLNRFETILRNFF